MDVLAGLLLVRSTVGWIFSLHWTSISFPLLSLLLSHISVLFSIRDASNATPLHEAAAHGHEQVVDLLLSYKADINAENMWEVCTLNLAHLHNVHHV